jgi:hypothetical protein
VVVGTAHPLGHGRGDGVREPVGEVAELVELAALDNRVVEHVAGGAPECLGAVDDTQDGPGSLQAPFAEVGQQVAHDGGVLGGALGQAERDLGAIQGGAEGDPRRCGRRP